MFKYFEIAKFLVISKYFFIVSKWYNVMIGSCDVYNEKTQKKRKDKKIQCCVLRTIEDKEGKGRWELEKWIIFIAI